MVNKTTYCVGIILFLSFKMHLGAHVDYLSMAKSAFKSKDYNKAITYCDFFLKSKPYNTEALVLKGKSYLELEHYHEALDNFNNCVNISPQESNFHYFKGFCEYRLRRYNSAMRSLDMATELSPDNLLAYNYLGCIFHELKMYKEAKKNFDMAIDMQPDLSVNVFVKQRFIEEYSQEYKYSLRLANAEIKKSPESVAPIFYRGILKVMVGDNWGANLDFNEVVEKGSDNAFCLFYRGYVNCSLRKFQEAVNDLHKFSQQFPKEEQVHEIISNILALSNTKIVLPKEEQFDEQVYLSVEEMPEYVGGMKEMYKFIAQNIRYPEQALDEEISGKVVLSFVVDTKGHIRNIEVVKPLGGGCEQEAIRVIKKMPAWRPGRNKGEPVSVKFTMPITFTFAN